MAGVFNEIQDTPDVYTVHIYRKLHTRGNKLRKRRRGNVSGLRTDRVFKKFEIDNISDVCVRAVRVCTK